MRNFLIILLFALPALAGRCVDAPEDTIRFYVVSDKFVTGGRYVDTPECPKVGYISSTPNLSVTRLQSVSTNASHSVYLDHMQDVVSTDVVIEMFQSDAKLFAELTRQNIGNRVLISLGNRPLIAPIIQMPIKSGEIQISLGAGRDVQGIAAQLKKFVRQK